jgi:uncharacterized membrane protein
MYLIRSLLVYGWIALMAVYGAKQAIGNALIVSTKDSRSTSFLLAHDDSSLFFPNKPGGNVLTDLLHKPVLKSSITYFTNNIITANYYNRLFLCNQSVNWLYYLSKIIFPFHYFW